jgi:hypothetical protein
MTKTATATPFITEAREPILSLMHERAKVKAMLDAANARALAAAHSFDDLDSRQTSSEYRAAAQDAGHFLAIYLDVCAAICRTSAATLEGALARLEVAADVIRDARGSDRLDIDEMGVLGALDDLKRLFHRAYTLHNNIVKSAPCYVRRRFGFSGVSPSASARNLSLSWRFCCIRGENGYLVDCSSAVSILTMSVISSSLRSTSAIPKRTPLAHTCVVGGNGIRFSLRFGQSPDADEPNPP